MSSNRLRHSVNGFKRYIQTSQIQLFIFIEGKINDPYFYGEIFENIKELENISYRILKASDLSYNVDGKRGLIECYKDFKKDGYLHSSYNGKFFAALFYLDKDIDNFTNKLIISGHIIYTQYYDIENHIFLEGNIFESVAASLTIEKSILDNSLKNNSAWCKEKALVWKEWVKLCFYSMRKKVNCGSTYGSKSQINASTFGNLNIHKLEQYKLGLQKKLQMTDKNFKISYSRITNVVDILFDEDNYNSVFKGKWYLEFLNDYALALGRKHSINQDGFKTTIISCILMTMSFDDPWTAQFRNPLKEIISRYIY